MNILGLGLMAIASAGSLDTDESELSHIGAFLYSDPITIRENWRQSEDYVRYVRDQESIMRAFGQGKLWEYWLAEADWCRIVWYYADDLSHYSVTVQVMDPDSRRMILLRAIKMLKAKLPRDSYLAGHLPPPWPIWIFKEIE